MSQNMTADYTPQELMVVCAARQIRDGEVVFVGMRLPLLAFALAKRTHAPNAIGLFENGLVRDTPSRRAAADDGRRAEHRRSRVGDPHRRADGPAGAGIRQPGLRRRRGGGSLRQPQHVVYRPARRIQR